MFNVQISFRPIIYLNFFNQIAKYLLIPSLNSINKDVKIDFVRSKYAANKQSRVYKCEFWRMNKQFQRQGKATHSLFD